MPNTELHETARALVAEGKGILAADESDGTIKKRFDTIGVESTEENRRAYRNLLFTTPGAEEYISGVILFDETIRQKADDGTPFPELLASKGVIPGIKVDQGAKPLAHAEGETVTEGLDGLRERLEEYRELGARFAKWRATYSISRHAAERVLHLDERARPRPLRRALPGGRDRPDRRARGAAGRDALDRAQRLRHLPRARRRLHRAVRPARRRRGDAAQAEHGPLRLRGVDRAGVEEVAEATLHTLTKHVPAAVPGIVFLSGGQSDEDATAHLNAMNARGPHPWQLSFSYGRALQAPALKAWGGKEENIEAGQRAYYHRAKMNAAARTGTYAPAMEREAVGVS